MKAFVMSSILLSGLVSRGLTPTVLPVPQHVAHAAFFLKGAA